MKKILGLILVLIIPLGCATVPSPEQMEVEKLMDRFTTGLREENIELLMSAYWPEAQMVIKLPDGAAQQFSGSDQIREVQLGGFGDPNRQILGFSDQEGEILSNSATYRIITHVPGVRVLNSFELTRRDGRWGIIHQMLEVLPPEEAGAGGQRYPGPPEATALLEAWEKAVRTHDLDLLKEIMPEPYLRYTQESGEEVAFQGFDAFAAFRLDFFTGLGAREDYRLPPLGEYYKYEVFDVYKFEHEKPPTSEMIYLEKVEGRWRIDHIDMITWKNGPFVTNKLQALGDRNGDGFITPEDDGVPTFSEMVHWFFRGPHECATAYDEFFDGNRDGFISEGELRQATDILIRRGLRFVRDLGQGLTKDIDLNNDGGLDDGEIDRIADFLLGETDLPLERGRFLNVLWWLPMPDALFQEVPREVSNYIDELADGNDDGRIDRVEQGIIISSLTKSGQAVNYFERAFDRNRDGYINWNEQRLVMQSAAMGWSFRLSARPPFPVVSAVDAMLDSNRDALVDAGEIQRAVVLFSGGEPDAAASVSQDLRAFLDTDKNGSLDIGEIEMGKARLLFPRRIDSRNRMDRAWDLDGSGYLEASELGITAGDSNGNPVRAFNERIDLYRRQGEASRISREREEIAAGREVKPDIGAQAYRGSLQSLKGKYLVVLEVEAGLVALEPKITKILTTFIENAFVNLGSVIIVDRRNLDKIMDEISLQASGLVDEGMAIKLGQLSGAEVIAAGEIDQLGDTYYLNVKLISVETGEILSCSMAKGQNTSEFLEMANRAVGRLF